MIYRKLIGIFSALVTIIMLGTAGYVLIERWTVLEGVYMTVITLSSVGFMEVQPLSEHGRIFTMFLILCGSGILVYGVSVITAFVVEGELTDVLRRTKMEKKIARLRGHFIVCGADHTGRYVIDEMVKTKRDFVVIEKDREKVSQLISSNVLCIEGDATHDAVLMKAGIGHAAGFITSLHSDAENLFVVITAKRLNPGLRVISKAVEEESEQKIRMVGADGVVMPNAIGGLRMVSEMIRPSVVNFLDVMLRSKDKTIRIEEVPIAAGSGLSGRSLSESGLPDLEGVTVVALKGGAEGLYVFNPKPSTMLKDGDIIIAMGDVGQIAQIRERALPR